MNIIEIKHLKYTYSDGTIALRDISITIENNKKVAILGSNGCGKSTLLQHLNGLMLPQEGSIKIKGITMEKGHLQAIRKIVGLVFDHPDDQLFAATVYDDVAFGPRNLGYNKDQVETVVNKALDLVNIQELKDRQPFNLSFGQKKKVAIAGVLAMEPSIIVFDEPFSGLDPYSLEQFLAILDTLHKLGTTIIITTHDVDIAYEWGDECIILNQGKVLKQGKINLLENESLMKEAKLKIPNLYHMFSNTRMYPRSVLEGKEIITQRLTKD